MKIATYQRHIRQTFLLVALLTLAVSNANAAATGGGSFEAGKANYFNIDKPFVVNIRDGAGGLRFMQIGINLMTMDAAVVTAVEKHLAPIKHELIMLFSQQQFKKVTSRGAREQLRKNALAQVQSVLQEYANIAPDKKLKNEDGEQYLSSVQDLFFTNFIIQ